MTMPRELHCGHTREEAGRFKEYIMTEVKFPSESTYYSQDVLDEKDARIKELEKQIRHKDKRIMELQEESSYLHKIVDHHEAMENDDDF